MPLKKPAMREDRCASFGKSKPQVTPPISKTRLTASKIVMFFFSPHLQAIFSSSLASNAEYMPR